MVTEKKKIGLWPNSVILGAVLKFWKKMMSKSHVGKGVIMWLCAKPKFMQEI